MNYPTTEYLQLPFLDLSCFNVYLERQKDLEAYLARLQNLADHRPLLVAEFGLDSRRHSEGIQAETLNWQVRTAFAAGCAGAIVFSWTDEWYRGGYDITDWDFGITRRDRSPKPALTAVSKAFGEVPFPADLDWPPVSVIVCSYNGARTIDECLKALHKLEYPRYEVIVVDDGSTDRTAEIARQYGARVVGTKNHGLSSARNTGLEAATGDIVAYTDDDTVPDPHWLQYLASTFRAGQCTGVGGPSPAPPGDGAIAECVANAPGGPAHVLMSDREAEHIPGCNMAFWKADLQAVGGFDSRFRVAGDDVDLCWHLQEQGSTIGFHPAAIVWHHRRNSVRAYWRQQFNYGRAEAMLEAKWPERYNSLGHLIWRGRLYGQGISRALAPRRWRVYHGVWGTGHFQSIYEASPLWLSAIPLMPEWYLAIAGLVALSLLGILWRPLMLAAPVALVATAWLSAHCAVNAMESTFSDEPLTAWSRGKRYAVTTLLHLLQPLARMVGRLSVGLTPWQRSRVPSVLPRPRAHAVWSERWRSLDKRLESIEAALRERGAVVRRGSEWDRWDLEIRGGLFGTVRIEAATEEHGAGKQLIRIRSWPRIAPAAFAIILLFLFLAAGAGVSQVGAVATILAAMGAGVAAAVFLDCAAATAALLCGLEEYRMAGGHLVGERDTAATGLPAKDDDETELAGGPTLYERKAAE